MFDESSNSGDFSLRLSYERALKEEAITNMYFNGPIYDKDLCLSKEVYYVGHVSRGLSLEVFKHPMQANRFLTKVKQSIYMYA